MTEERELETLDEASLPPPRGALFIMLVYVLVLAGMWGAMYWQLLGR
jgi:hypothetical protein